MSDVNTVLPPSTLGILGGGQLGRMFANAASTLGYDVVVFDPDKSSPAGRVAAQHICAHYDDENALDKLVEECDVLTIEFENIPLSTIRYLEKKIAVYPASNAIEIAQNRIKEKTFIQSIGLKTAAFSEINSIEDCELVPKNLFPAILKTNELGYDGKGQVVCNSMKDLKEAYMNLGQVACVLENKIDLKTEISVIICRGLNGQVEFFPAAENQHVNAILDTSIVPARVPELIAKRAQKQALKVADALNYCGILAIEFFISAKGDLLINEMAPRPHNSGHFTMDACITSQFEQQVRMMCQLPSGSCKLISPVVMWNIIGDIWPEEDEPEWPIVLKNKHCKLHLYGKKQAREGRKMGHINILCRDTSQGIDLKQDLTRYFS